MRPMGIMLSLTNESRMGVAEVLGYRSNLMLFRRDGLQFIEPEVTYNQE